MLLFLPSHEGNGHEMVNAWAFLFSIYFGVKGNLGDFKGLACNEHNELAASDILSSGSKKTELLSL